MYSLPILAITSFVAVVTALPTQLKRATTISDSYVDYKGDGSTTAGWPSQDTWGSYTDLWNANVPLMQQSCGWNGWGTDNSADEINLAIVMQESKGCVRVPTTNNGIVNPGLMQSHDGSGSCAGVDPCPASTILQMIEDGTAGTSSGDGLEQLLAQAEGALSEMDARAYYSSARLYNSGSVDYTNLDNGFTSTACYAEDVANRLTGWTLAASACTA